jgi:hypothetical protein
MLTQKIVGKLFCAYLLLKNRYVDELNKKLFISVKCSSFLIPPYKLPPVPVLPKTSWLYAPFICSKNIKVRTVWGPNLK